MCLRDCGVGVPFGGSGFGWTSVDRESCGGTFGDAETRGLEHKQLQAKQLRQ